MSFISVMLLVAAVPVVGYACLRFKDAWLRKRYNIQEEWLYYPDKGTCELNYSRGNLKVLKRRTLTPKDPSSGLKPRVREKMHHFGFNASRF